MTELNTAIYGKANTDGNFKATLNHENIKGEVALHFFNRSIDEDAAFPYSCFYSIIDTTSKDSASKFSTILLQISFYDQSNSSKTVSDLDKYCRALFDECTLEVEGYKFISMVHNFSREMPSNNKELRQIDSQYTIELQK